MTARYYQTGLILLEALTQLDAPLKQNYEKGNVQQKALATIALLQGDLFSSYLTLLDSDEKGPLVGRAVILRVILENQGAILHIKDSEKRSKEYLDFVSHIRRQVKDQIEGRKIDEATWSSSTITQRVGLIDTRAQRLYNTLSNFVHGNNMLYYLDTKEITQAFIKAIDSFYIGVFIGFLTELAVGLDMENAKRKLVFDAIDKTRRI